MVYARRRVNLVLSGGGVKGIAYLGVSDVAEKRGYRWGNIAGVSAGALVGALAASGFTSYEMWKAMERFDFEGIQLEKNAKRIPVVSDYLRYISSLRNAGPESIEEFFSNRDEDRKRSFLKNIITYGKQGCLFKGEYLEEWCAEELAKKGVRTFGDLRGGRKDAVNPRGYRLRMTGVDCNRGKIVVMPDDISYYGIEPDEFEVAKAVRISTCVPFAFKPVVLEKKEGEKVKRYNL
ncbi:MAG: patatin-like phospholipase family protein, partial [Firmicutes bacterium]|nr:patatin-like phospholipase family protein [Bacillota bacterium]